MTKLKVTPLTGSIGASVEGIDLNSPIDRATFAALHDAFLTHCVLIYRGQQLKPAAQVDFGRLWGTPLNTHPLL
jgi:taurine dioxygenase